MKLWFLDGLRSLFWLLVIVLVVLFSSGTESEFIYNNF